MRAGLYARVSTERQAERGTIGSQLALLRNTSPPPVTSWSASMSTTGIPVPDWTGPVWMRCVMPPRLG